MSAAPPSNQVAIIGAGLAGLTLALSLHRASIPCTIYELRSAASAAEAGGAIMISPNGLRILDTLGLYQSLAALGWSFESLHYVEESSTTGTRTETGHYDLGNEKLYGYKALRVYRKEVLRLLRDEVARRGICVEYERKYTGVVSEGKAGVRISFADGVEVDAGLVVGADGIHSSVRRYVVPEVTGPRFSGVVAVTGAVDREKLGFGGVPEEVPMPVTLQGDRGAFVFAPQNPAASELLCGTQFKYPEQDREGWAKLLEDREQMREMLGHDKEASALVKSAVANVKEESLNVWAFYLVPQLRTWASEGKRVVILGDAAHAIPPTTGQGATQAFEDGFSLAALLQVVAPGQKGWGEAVEWWHGMRMLRVRRILGLTSRLNNARLPKEARDKLPLDKLYSSDGQEDLSWLYNHHVEEEVQDWTKKESCPVKRWLKSR